MNSTDFHKDIIAAEVYKRITAILYWDEKFRLGEIECLLELVSNDNRFAFLTKIHSHKLTAHMVYEYGGNPTIPPIHPQWNSEKNYHAYSPSGNRYIKSEAFEQIRGKLLGENGNRCKMRTDPFSNIERRENVDTTDDYLRLNLVCQARSVDALVILLRCLTQGERRKALCWLTCGDGSPAFMNIRSKYFFYDELLVKLMEIMITETDFTDFTELLKERDQNGKTFLLKIIAERYEDYHGKSERRKDSCYYKICEILRKVLKTTNNSDQLRFLHTADNNGHTLQDLVLSSASNCLLKSILENLSSLEQTEYIGKSLHEAVEFDNQHPLNQFGQNSLGMYCCFNPRSIDLRSFTKASTILESLDEPGRLTLLQRKEGLLENTPLHLAESQESFLEILLSIPREARPGILKQQNAQNNTPLHIYPQHIKTLTEATDTTDAIKLLSMQNNSGETVLHNVLRNYPSFNSRVLEELKIQNGTPFLQLQNYNGDSVLHQLAKHSSVLLFLLDLVPESHIFHILSLKNSQDATVLHLLDYSGPKFISQVLTRILDNRHKVDLLTAQDLKDVTPIHIIVQQGFDHTLEAVFENIDPNLRFELVNNKDHNGNSPLHYAAIEKHGKTIKLILDQLTEEEKYNILKLPNKHRKTVIHLAIAKELWYGVYCIGEAIGSRKTLEILEISMTDQGVIHLQTSIENDDLGMIKACLQDYDSRSRHLINSVFGSITTSQNLSTAVHDLDEQEFQVIEQKISDTSVHELSAEVPIIQEHRYKNDATPFHMLAQRGDCDRLQKLLDSMDDQMRNDMMSLKDINLKTPYNYATEYKVRHLLEWSSRQDGFYYLPKPPKVIVMYSTDDRDGAEQEVDSLEKALPKFRVKPIMRKDPTKNTIVDTIRQSQIEDISGLIVIMMSHGVQGAVCTADDDISIQEILQTMCSPTIDGKPKVLLVQACQTRDQAQPSGVRGSLDPAPPSSQRRPQPASTSSPSVGTASRLTRSQPQDTMPQHFKIQSRDVITMMATVDGEVAYRNFMIPMFAEELRSSANNGDIYEIFLKTHEKLVDRLPADARQIPEFRSTLTKKLCLRNIFVPQQ